MSVVQSSDKNQRPSQYMVTALAHVRSGPKYKEKTLPLREEEVKLKVTKIHFIHML